MLSRGFGMNSYTALNPLYCIVPSETNLDWQLWHYVERVVSPEPQWAAGAGDDGREAGATELVNKRRVTLVSIADLNKRCIVYSLVNCASCKGYIVWLECGLMFLIFHDLWDLIISQNDELGQEVTEISDINPDIFFITHSSHHQLLGCHAENCWNMRKVGTILHFQILYIFFKSFEQNIEGLIPSSAKLYLINIPSRVKVTTLQPLLSTIIPPICVFFSSP